MDHADVVFCGGFQLGEKKAKQHGNVPHLRLRRRVLALRPGPGPHAARPGRHRLRQPADPRVLRRRRRADRLRPARRARPPPAGLVDLRRRPGRQDRPRPPAARPEPLLARRPGLRRAARLLPGVRRLPDALRHEQGDRVHQPHEGVWSTWRPVGRSSARRCGTSCGSGARSSTSRRTPSKASPPPVERALSEGPDSERVQRGLELAKAASWEATVDRMQSLIADATSIEDRPSAKHVEPAPEAELAYVYAHTPGS